MKHLLLVLAVVFFAACSSAHKDDPVNIKFVAPVITDQEYAEGLPAPAIEYSKNTPYETQVRNEKPVLKAKTANPSVRPGRTMAQ